MATFHRVILLAISAIAFLAVIGAANAATVVKVDTVQTNGYYIGVPRLISGDTYQYGYVYTFIPDGTFTVIGTIINDGPASVVESLKAGLPSESDPKLLDVFVPPSSGGKAGQAGFVITVAEPSEKDIVVWHLTQKGWILVDMDGVDYVDLADILTHTVDQGPMSNMVAVYKDGRFDFGGSPLYSFVT